MSLMLQRASSGWVDGLMCTQMALFVNITKEAVIDKARVIT